MIPFCLTNVNVMLVDLSGKLVLRSILLIVSMIVFSVKWSFVSILWRVRVTFD